MDRLYVGNFIDIDTWNEAGWCGILFAVDPQGTNLPALGIVFTNEEAGKKVFSDWIDRLGKEDESELLRVSIIEGDIPGKSPGYSVFIGTDLENYIAYLKSHQLEFSNSVLMASGRFVRMTPQPDSPFLPTFKESYQAQQQYQLIPAFGGLSDPKPEFSLAIKKKKVQFLRADELGENDQERVVLQAED